MNRIQFTHFVLFFKNERIKQNKENIMPIKKLILLNPCSSIENFAHTKIPMRIQHLQHHNSFVLLNIACLNSLSTPLSLNSERRVICTFLADPPGLGLSEEDSWLEETSLENWFSTSDSSSTLEGSWGSGWVWEYVVWLVNLFQKWVKVNIGWSEDRNYG